MMVMVLVGVLMVLAVGCGGIIHILRRRRCDLPPAPDNWWPQFERQFRAYAIRDARVPRDVSHRGRRPRHGD